MNLEKIKKNLEQQFVDDYDDLVEFMININDTLLSLNIDSQYQYNDFCLDIQENVIKIINEENIKEITPQILSKSLNNMIKIKIVDDPDFEKKLTDYFDGDSDIMNDIKQLKIDIKKDEK